MKNIVSSLYAEYGRYIDSFRAIPKDADCLKPVERRLLLSVHEVARKKLEKSAKVIGTCIGNYHPHGDCLDKNTKLFSLDGNIQTIEDVYLSGISSLDVIGVDKNNNLIPVKAHSFRIGQYATSIFNINLLDGSVIKTTNNHQFNTLNRGWVKAENLETSDTLVSIRAEKNNGYIHLTSFKFDKPLHKMVYEFYNGTISNIIHHKDENKFNNSLSNLEELTRSEHAKLHYKEVNRLGLEKGRVSMFSENGEHREKIKEKNQNLIRLYNNQQPVFKAIRVLKALRNKNIELNIDNYRSYRNKVGVYNAPYIESILYNRGIKSFDNLVSVIDSFKLDTSSIKTSPGYHTRTNTSKITSNEIGKLSQIIVKMKEKFNHIDYSYYEICRNELINKTGLGNNNISGRSYPAISKLQGINPNLKDLAKELGVSSQIIDSITIEHLSDPIPMYDFTVDDHENMFIVGNTFENGISLVNVHNSSTYDSLVSLVQRGFVDGQGNWGRYGLEDSRAAAYRYTECKANDNLNSIFADYLKLVPWEPLELENEPLYIPFPIPLGLIGSGVTTGIGFHITRIPRFGFRDLIQRLVELLENLPLTTIIPVIDDCTLYEDSPGEFNRLLTTGEGRIQIVPNVIVSSTDIIITGRNPMIGFNGLKVLNEKYEETNGTPMFSAIDLWDYTCKTSINIKVSNVGKGKYLSQSFIDKILLSVSSIVNFKVNVVENNLVVLKSIDTLLLECYEKWKLANLKFYQTQLEFNLNKLEELKIIQVIREIIKNNPGIQKVDEIVQLNTSNYLESELRSVCSKHSIKTLIEAHIDINSVQNKINSLTNTINNIDNVVLNEMKKKFLGY